MIFYNILFSNNFVRKLGKKVWKNFGKTFGKTFGKIKKKKIGKRCAKMLGKKSGKNPKTKFVEKFNQKNFGISGFFFKKIFDNKISVFKTTMMSKTKFNSNR